MSFFNTIRANVKTRHRYLSDFDTLNISVKFRKETLYEFDFQRCKSHTNSNNELSEFDMFQWW